tara:strand:- start:500 stop:766 length:267 start_codon:yes stop_codon:yes gene_type:complete
MDVMVESSIVDNYKNYVFILDKNFDNFLLIDKNHFQYLVSNIYSNNLLILFSFTFFTTLYCCIMREKKINKNQYIVVEQSEAVKGEIV